MIKFFNSIRQRLLKEGAVKKYGLYALGEIALVMIGILLALQVNNWNEGKKLLAIEKNYLLALKEEFELNKKELNKAINQNNSNLKYALKLSENMRHDKPMISEKEFSKLGFGVMNNEVQYRPSQGVMDEIISSGKLEIFKNVELRYALSSWNRIVERAKFQEMEHAATRFDLINITNKKGDFRSAFIDTYGEEIGITSIDSKQSNLPLLQSTEYDNYLVGFIITGKYLNDNYYSAVEKEIDKIVLLIDKELKK